MQLNSAAQRDTFRSALGAPTHSAPGRERYAARDPWWNSLCDDRDRPEAIIRLSLTWSGVICTV